MTESEIRERIKKERRHVRRVRDKITDLKFDIDATRKTIAYWQKQLKEARNA